MADPFLISGDDSEIVALTSSGLSGTAILGEAPYDFGIYSVLSSVLIASETEIAAFKMPEIYEFLPEIVRAQDTTLIDRGNVPLYVWDTVPVWDEDPYTWDEVIGPEPILKATCRVMQLELEKTCTEIMSLSLLNSLSKVPKEFLPYQAALLGTPLPSANELSQRAFLKELVQTYRKKGTPLSFFRLFEQLGFSLTLEEQYQRRLDAAEISGPQMALKQVATILDEPVGTTVSGQTEYEFQVLNTPITKGTVKLHVYDQSTSDPSVFIDNGHGMWSDGTAGTIDYFTGHVTITLPSTPALVGQPLQMSYDQQVDAFPDLDRQRYTDRFRSSVVKFAVTPKSPSTSLTVEIIDRMELYLELLKPAHVIIRNLELLLELSDSENVNLDDDINPLTYQFIESVFGTLYLGYGWASEDNGSLNPYGLTTQHRTGPEFLTVPNVYGGDCPYVYPWLANGNFKQHPILSGLTAEADWTETALTPFDSDVTADIAATTTNVSITKGAGTVLGVGDKIAIKDGPAGGEARVITVFTDSGTYYDVQWTTPLSVAPATGNLVVVLPVEAVNLQNLETGFRQQDPLDVYFGFDLLDTGAPPDGLLTGPFTVTSTKIPFLAASTTYLRFTIGTTDYVETATGTGAFSNTSGHISASSVNYTTGAASVTFGTAPDAGSAVTMLNVIAATADIGTY